MSGNRHPLRDIDTRSVGAAVLMSPALGGLLQSQANLVAALYRARVAKRTGKLAGSTNAFVTMGGHQGDRLVGKVTVGTGLEYGALHEFGAPSNPNRQAAKDLAEVVDSLTKGA
ncbi:HK97 gp10 family phage protein [Mycolicibacterium palauense]|uniref:HK97 gp10 family phage protein n=1 Tax=Mycolicibacterium palauense TaxID=2034511 RepID=UPI000BFED1C2|nr:HK97 gp10 family phage protein [Mycolicibacterium palauense]